MNRIFANRRTPFVFVFAASLGLVLGGVAFSELMGLGACPLCIIQRMLYLGLAIVAGVGLFVAGQSLASRLFALAMATVAATGIFVAGYQVWIQRFAPETNCSPYPTWWEEMVDRAGEQVPILFSANGLCSDPAWKFLGLSIADWSLAWFTLFLLVAVYIAFRQR
ncbi:MAG: disulfide bond formation protein B [Gammaproteobacteria bacterium]|nr:disulfide bond formation protein B [Gammaproteobacteria bacterium]MBU1416399.1 disulfide bond formation protein B [Gammaproteobacteria bacterium]